MKYSLLCLVVLTLAFPVNAKSYQSKRSTKKVRPKKDSAKLYSNIILAPTWATTPGEFYTENTVELGVKFNKKVRLGYNQFIFTRPFHAETQVKKSMQPYLFDGFFRFRINPAFVDRIYGIEFSYEPRLYLPTHDLKREAGMLFAVRNMLKFMSPITKSFRFTFWETPVLHAYNRSGANLRTGSKVANPIFENRIDTGFELDVGKFTFYLPLMYYVTKFRNFEQDARHNNNWHHFVGLAPGVEVGLSKIFRLGAWYYTGNFIQKDEAGTHLFADTWQDGLVQMTFGLSF